MHVSANDIVSFLSVAEQYFTMCMNHSSVDGHLGYLPVLAIVLVLLVPADLLAFQVALVVKNLPPNAGDVRYGFNPFVGKIPWRKELQLTPVFLPGESQDRGAQQVGRD